MKINYNLLLIFTFLITTSIHSYSQSFDEAFLQSLPEDVREDLLRKKNENDEKAKVNYRNPSTFIDKDVPINVEENELTRYGEKIFSMMQSSFMPLNEPNMDPSYILDYGDVLEIQFVGQKSSIVKTPIKRDGSISIPEIGKIYLSGLSLSEASSLINQKINEVFIGVDSFISLINVRDIQIIIAGNVSNAGSYTLSGNSNIFHALHAAGGPSENGSFRDIKVVRNNEIIESIDLYSTFIYGKTTFNKRLRSGDLVFVKPVQNLVTIQGAVNRPGIYELLKDEKLSKAVFFANNLTINADSSEFNLVRIVDGKVTKNKIDGIQDLDDITSQDYDQLNIRKFPFRNVTIEGAVKNPGEYLLNEGDGILELINRAGGYTESAYPFGGVLENEATKKVNQLAKETLYEDFLDTTVNQLSSISGDGLSMDLIDLLTELKNIEVNGRVSAEFDISKLKDNPSLDLLLQDGDKIMIPEYLDHVYVFGEVSSEGTTRFRANKDFNYFINKKGGLTQYASKNDIFVLHPNGETYTISSKNLFIVDRNKVEIFPGSIIYVPRKMTNLAGLKTTQAYATILGNLGVSIASLAVLKD